MNEHNRNKYFNKISLVVLYIGGNRAKPDTFFEFVFLQKSEGKKILLIVSSL